MYISYWSYPPLRKLHSQPGGADINAVKFSPNGVYLGTIRMELRRIWFGSGLDEDQLNSKGLGLR